MSSDRSPGRAGRGWTRLAAVAVLTAAGVALAAGPAAAHVTVAGDGATQGGFAVITFRVPTESDTASTVGLKVQLPPNQPLAFASVQPKAGWSYKVTTTKLATPVRTDDGEVTEAPSEIEWKATGGGIKPGEFDQFQISAGPLPKADSMTFKAVQVYSDGEQVAWIDEPAGGTEPEHPAPVLELAAAGPETGSAASPGPTVTAAPPAAAPASDSASDSASQGSVIGAYVLAGLGLLAGLAGLALGLTARRRADRQPVPTPAPENTTAAR